MHNESMYEEITRRIEELRRPGWRWVKRAPEAPRTMCAVVDYIGSKHREAYSRSITDQRLSDETIGILDAWIANHENNENNENNESRRWEEFTGWNDASVCNGGPASVDEVIEMLEKFRAEL